MCNAYLHDHGFIVGLIKREWQCVLIRATATTCLTMIIAACWPSEHVAITLLLLALYGDWRRYQSSMHDVAKLGNSCSCCDAIPQLLDSPRPTEPAMGVSTV